MFRSGLALVILLVAMVLVFIARTRKLGAGLLISIAAGLFVDSASYAGLLIAGT